MRQSFGEEAAGKVEEALEPVHLPLASPRDALGISVKALEFFGKIMYV